MPAPAPSPIPQAVLVLPPQCYPFNQLARTGSAIPERTGPKLGPISDLQT
jgi:hypothetical protein